MPISLFTNWAVNVDYRSPPFFVFTNRQFLHFVQLSLNSGLENWDTKGSDINRIDKGQISTYRNKPQSSSLI